MEEAKKALEGSDIDAIKSAKEKLSEKAMALSARVYEEAAKTAQANPSEENAGSSDGVKEAEYEEK